jgi:hypothetical protein
VKHKRQNSQCNNAAAKKEHDCLLMKADKNPKQVLTIAKQS